MNIAVFEGNRIAMDVGDSGREKLEVSADLRAVHEYLAYGKKAIL